MIRLIAQFVLAGAVALGLVFAVAAQDQGTPTPGANLMCASPAAAATAVVGTASPVPCGTPVGQPGQQTVEMIDINFNPKELTIPANTDVTINLVNNGAANHNFNIDELNVHSGDYSPGQTGTVTINAAPGDYQYYCSIPGHKEAGMVGTLHLQ
jgi:nitrite reductase (NO-forming)